MVADVLGLGFKVGLDVATRCRDPIGAVQNKKAVEMVTSRGFSIFCMCDTRRFVHPHWVRTKKAAWLAATAGLVSARRGLVLTCKPSWLANAQHLSRRWSPQYPVLTAIRCYFVRISLPSRVARNW